jgi:hypothetical protein
MPRIIESPKAMIRGIIYIFLLNAVAKVIAPQKTEKYVCLVTKNSDIMPFLGTNFECLG